MHKGKTREVFGKTTSKRENLRPIFQRFMDKEEIRKGKIREYMSKRLWEIPQPEEVTFDGQGEKNLFHYMMHYQLGSVLKNGIVFGFVMYGNDEFLNAPNLTTESIFHNPSNFDDHKRETTYRLKIKCPTDADKLINMGWFDKTYNVSKVRHWNKVLTKCNRGTETDGFSRYLGDIDKQYIYKGHITPKMIKEVCRWNKETQYWDRVNKKELNEIISDFEKSKFINQYNEYVFPNKSRVRGTSLRNDLTGMVNKYFDENDHKEVLKDLYKVTDWVVLNLNDKLSAIWRYHIDAFIHDADLIQDLVNNAVTWYNRFNKNDELNPESLLNKIHEKILEYQLSYKELGLLHSTA